MPVLLRTIFQQLLFRIQSHLNLTKVQESHTTTTASVSRCTPAWILQQRNNKYSLEQNVGDLRLESTGTTSYKTTADEVG
jgi:hypothetical protein